MSGAYPGYAYDGGLRRDVDQRRAWTQITPVGGYPYLVRAGSTPGPFPAETPVYSGSIDWAQARLRADDLTGTVQFRFRFGSDGATGLEGWYIDDVMFIGGAPDASACTRSCCVPSASRSTESAQSVRRAVPATTLRFDLPQSAPVRLGVFDVGGRLVRTLVDGPLEAGEHVSPGTDATPAATLVGSGVYFYTLETSGRQIARRMLVVR